MAKSAANEMMAANMQAAPIRQSNTKSSTTSVTNMATVPEMSARLCASSVSVCAAAPSMRRRKSPDAWVSK